MNSMMGYMPGMMPMMQGNQNEAAKIETRGRFYGRERQSGTARWEQIHAILLSKPLHSDGH